jgi:hypothetical protein
MATVARKSTLKSPYLIKASGDQDHAAFAVRFTLRSSREAKASIASRLNVRDDAYAPDRGGDVRREPCISEKRKQNISFGKA